MAPAQRPAGGEIAGAKRCHEDAEPLLSSTPGHSAPGVAAAAACRRPREPAAGHAVAAQPNTTDSCPGHSPASGAQHWHRVRDGGGWWAMLCQHLLPRSATQRPAAAAGLQWPLAVAITLALADFDCPARVWWCGANHQSNCLTTRHLFSNRTAPAAGACGCRRWRLAMATR